MSSSVKGEYKGFPCIVEYTRSEYRGSNTNNNDFTILHMSYKDGNKFYAIEALNMTTEQYNWADALVLQHIKENKVAQFKKSYAPSAERKEFPPMGLDTLLPFGKNKGSSVRQVIIGTMSANGSYIGWLIGEGGTNFTDDVFQLEKTCQLVYNNKPEVYSALFKEYEKALYTFVGASDDLVQTEPQENEDVGF
jgi:hypothetical protein